MVKISVILTTYNSEKQLQKVLNSILNQEESNKKFKLELLIVDDCSTDNTTKILLENNLRFFSTKKNTGGPNYVRNVLSMGVLCCYN